uniref:Myosin phosphatase Rho interacting protein n=1 Tax=Myripristis murdjan TaxID=586833 RepID=A0A667YTK2_9TELE
MSGDKATSPCNKFQANIFNKSKCQNCFKSRELHLLADHDMEQAKPVYGGWLCLAPEGTDFNNPIQRSRKWQRRFFILYEHGSLSFALDELPSTLPQGTVNLNLCTEVIDAEPRTGQRNSLCIITPEQEICIRGENKEIINGWNEHLAAYPRANKQNQTKKRKVEPVATQEPSPAKMAATDPCFPTAESPAEPGSSPWQEDQLERRPNITPVWTVTDTDPPGPLEYLFPNVILTSGTAPGSNPWTSSVFAVLYPGNMSRYLCPVSRESLASDGSWLSGTLSGSVSSLDSAASGGSDPGDGNRPAEPEPNGVHTSADNKDQREDGRLETTRGQPSYFQLLFFFFGMVQCHVSVCSAVMPACNLPVMQTVLLMFHSTVCLCFIDKYVYISLFLQPDLLNFKKGWMVKLDEEDQWKKYWFVLSTDSLRYYKDSMAEEASDLEGEIDLTECYNVSEYQVQRNYGFQIHTRKGFYTLSAMTAGIRRNWIQALMKNVHPTNAPDVASLTGHHIPCKPDVTQDSSPAEASAETDKHSKPRTVTERRREGRYKTFDWAEFRPLAKPAPDLDARTLTGPCSFELGDPERKKRREERRRRYESMLGFPLALEAIGDHNAADGGTRASSPRSQQKMEEEIEQCWQQVERTVFRLERTVPLHTDARDAVEMETLLDGYRKGTRVEDLERELSVRNQQLLEAQSLIASLERRLKDSEMVSRQRDATYESGFTAMEESHQRLLDELQRRHHKEVERLLEDRDRRLEEETAATAIAIEAIKNAHRLELEREVQRRCQSKSAIGSTDLEEIWRQHREELASCERELEVLSQQYSLKCLENGHLAQALDAERKALCQCQQENQDLRTRNQELSSHLAAEITRLCSLAKQDAPPLSQGMDVYEMEITLRVKESEVQCLKQEIASLKDELQSAQRDKRSAAKKYKDIYTELSIVRAKSERDLEQLRENLRLARQAVDKDKRNDIEALVAENLLHPPCGRARPASSQPELPTTLPTAPFIKNKQQQQQQKQIEETWCDCF